MDAIGKLEKYKVYYKKVGLVQHNLMTPNDIKKMYKDGRTRSPLFCRMMPKLFNNVSIIEGDKSSDALVDNSISYEIRGNIQDGSIKIEPSNQIGSNRKYDEDQTKLKYMNCGGLVATLCPNLDAEHMFVFILPSDYLLCQKDNKHNLKHIYSKKDIENIIGFKFDLFLKNNKEDLVIKNFK